MARVLLPFVIVWILIGFPGVVVAEDDDLEDARASLEKDLAAALVDLAGWCTKKRLYGRRDAAFEVLLEVDPDHAEARKRLKYKKDEAGGWVQSPAYKPATNWKRDLVPESEERLAKIQADHLTALLQLYGRATALTDLLWARREVEALQGRYPADARLPKLLRTLVLRYYRHVAEKGLVNEMDGAAAFLRTHYPRDVEILGALGEVDYKGVRMLTETATTLKRGRDSATAARAALEKIELQPAKLDADEAKIKLPWTAGVATSDIRVVGTAKAEELRAVATHVQAAGVVFEGALNVPPSRRKGLTLVVLAGEGEDDTFVEAYPVEDNPSLQQRKKIGLDLVYLHGYAMLLRKNPADAQIDLAVNTVLNQIFSDTFLEYGAPRGWHAEGISRYLAYLLLGTRLSINVVGKYAGQGEGRNVPGSKDSWLANAKAQLAKNKRVGLQVLLGKGVDTFSARDAVVAYAFAVYLIESQGKLVAPFLQSHVRTSDVDKAAREILGMPRTVLEHRFVRWLDEIIAARSADDR